MQLKCWCGTLYTAREHDVKRNWAKTCSKSCAATKRAYGRPNATYPDGEKVTFGRKYKRKKPPADKRYRERQAQREAEAKLHGYYPFNSEDEMNAAMCDNPIEGR